LGGIDRWFEYKFRGNLISILYLKVIKKYEKEVER
jgi:hypothetical protein